MMFVKVSLLSFFPFCVVKIKEFNEFLMDVEKH